MVDGQRLLAIYAAPPARDTHRRMKTLARSAGLLAAAGLLLAATPARASCPREAPSDPACDPYVTMLMPTAIAVAWFPRQAGGMYFGGGVEIGFVGWSSNNDSYGPSHGRFYGSAAVLESTEKHRAVLWRFGGVVSFEG